MHPLTMIVCGQTPPKGIVSETLLHLGGTLDRLVSRTLILKGTGDDIELALFGPYLGRATIEVALTAILGRFDPFRLLAIRRAQAASNYDPRQRNPLAFNWAADVQGDDKPKDWEQRPNLKDLQRALLCKHFNDVFWQEAFTELLDAVPDGRGATWMAKLKRIDPEGFTVAMRYEADKIYSELSKGVHHEFVTPTAQYDSVTVRDLLGRSWELVATLGLTACFWPSLKQPATSDLLKSFESIQEEIVVA